MARKDILKGLLDPSPPHPAPLPASATVAGTQPARGAIGAVSRSIADLKSRAVVELDPGLIDAGGLADRLETDEQADAALRASISEYGQQVPVLVRPHPEVEGRFQIVYGRRRVLALRDLGQPVKALIRDLDDRALILAQGQENTARRDLSFIEKVNFARQLEQHGYDRKVICDALSVDKTLASRMLSIAARLPAELIAVIGAAPSIGRDRWTALADLLEQTGAEVDDIEPMIVVTARSAASDDRFLAAWDYLVSLRDGQKVAQRPAPGPAQPVVAADGQTLGQARLDDRFLTLKLRLSRTAGFEAWLLENMASLHASWQQSGTDELLHPNPKKAR